MTTSRARPDSSRCGPFGYRWWTRPRWPGLRSVTSSPKYAEDAFVSIDVMIVAKSRASRFVLPGPPGRAMSPVKSVGISSSAKPNAARTCDRSVCSVRMRKVTEPGGPCRRRAGGRSPARRHARVLSAHRIRRCRRPRGPVRRRRCGPSDRASPRRDVTPRLDERRAVVGRARSPRRAGSPRRCACIARRGRCSRSVRRRSGATSSRASNHTNSTLSMVPLAT